MTSTSLIISDITIHQDADGRYSLNDLHKAAGNHDKDKPANFMRSEKTVEIKDVLIAQNRAFKPAEVRKGRHGGTYVCKELVYAYAMWISAEFALKVIRAYDALVSGHIGKKTTVADRTPLRHAVNMLVSKKHLPYPEAWALVHQRFNVEHVDDLPADALTEAIEYVHRLALEGEYISRPASIPQGVRGVVALYMDGPEVVRSEYRTGVVHVGTVDEFESIIRHYGGMVLWDEKQQREFVRERALMRL